MSAHRLVSDRARTAVAGSRAFTLVELMVASAIAAILVAAGAELASAMARNVKKSEEQSEIGVRGAIAHSFLQSELGSAAYNWNTPQAIGLTNTGSFGPGNCASTTGICALAGGKFFPLRICKSSTVGSTTCDDPVVTEADALMTYTPRDPLVEAVRIRSMGDLSAIPTSCGLTNPAALRISGKNSRLWAAGDFVLVSHQGHSSIAVVAADFAADTTEPTGGRTISLDFDTTNSGSGLGIDDGDRPECNPRASLLTASVMRIQQVIVKLDETPGSPTFKNLLVRKRVSTADTSGFSPIISNVDDFQVRLDLARITTVVSPAVAATSFCTVDNTSIFAGGAIAACGGDRLNADPTTLNSLRVIGMNIALVLRTSVQTENGVSPIPFQFDRTGPTASDKRFRRIVSNYVGLPNASSF